MARAMAPTDYTATAGTLTFAPGETQHSVTVKVNGDTTFEADETFKLGLTGPGQRHGRPRPGHRHDPQ